MNTASWIFSAVILWILGYWATTTEDARHGIKMITAPKWLYLLFGKPRMENAPAQIMTMGGVYLQLMSYSFVLYALILDKRVFSNPAESGMFGVTLCAMTSGLLARLIFKISPYKLE